MNGEYDIEKWRSAAQKVRAFRYAQGTMKFFQGKIPQGYMHLFIAEEKPIKRFWKRIPVHNFYSKRRNRNI